MIIQFPLRSLLVSVFYRALQNKAWISNSKLKKNPVSKISIEKDILANMNLKGILLKHQISIDIIRDRFNRWYNTKSFRIVKRILTS